MHQQQNTTAPWLLFMAKRVRMCDGSVCDDKKKEGFKPFSSYLVFWADSFSKDRCQIGEGLKIRKDQNVVVSWCSMYRGNRPKMDMRIWQVSRKKLANGQKSPHAQNRSVQHWNGKNLESLHAPETKAMIDTRKGILGGCLVCVIILVQIVIHPMK